MCVTVRIMTCDVCWTQFSDRQHDGCRCSLSRSNTLLPGKVMLSRVANELYAFWNGDFNMNLQEEGRGEIRNKRCPLTGHNCIIPPGTPLCYLACSPQSSEFLNRVMTHASQAP